MTPDLIVVGGGPAGLAAAIAAARHGVNTLVLERRTLPIDKACGEGLLPNGVEALARFGLPAAALVRAATPLRGIRYITTSGRTAASLFSGGFGLGIRRVCLSQELLTRAGQETTLELRTGVAAEIRCGSDGPTVAVPGATWAPRLVIGADGLQSRVRRSCGIPTVQGRRRRWGVRQHFSGEAWTDHVEIYFGRGCEAYVTPVDGGVNVAWLWQPDAIPEVPGPIFERFLSRMPALAARLAGRQATDRPAAVGPFRHQPGARARDGVLLMGDAAGYLDPLTGEGVGLALTQAELFEEHVVPLLVGNGDRTLRASAFGPYLRAVDIASKPNHDLTRLMLGLVGRPLLVERLVGALAADPVLFRHCLDANMGRAPLWRLPATSVLALGAALCRPSALSSL